MSMRQRYYFYSILLITLAILSLTHPFMRYPYDIWEHLFIMDSEYANLVNMPEDRKIWHYLWSSIFDLVGIENSQILLRARIIHVIQIWISFFAIFTFGRVSVRILFRDIDSNTINYIALWATFIWFTIFATFSLHYHQVWIMWYSVNYQISLPLFWYSIALVLILLFESVSRYLQIFYILQAMFIFIAIMLIHPMEFLYLLMYITLLSMIYIDIVWIYIKRYYIYMIPVSIVVVTAISYRYHDQLPPIIEYLSLDRLPQLYHLIEKNGDLLVTQGFNRAFASFNELMILSIIFGLLLLVVSIFRKFRDMESILNFRFYLFLLVTSLLVLIPLFEFSSGLASVITKVEVVNRFYYSASIFVILPISIYYIYKLIYKDRALVIFNSTMIVVILSTILYSREFTTNKRYYKNIKSFEYSFQPEKVGFHLSQDNIDTIGRELKEYEKSRDHTKKVLYLARGDIAMVLRYIYRVNVYWRGRSANPTYQDMIDYKRIKQNSRVEFIIFKTPKSLPEYEPYL